MESYFSLPREQKMKDARPELSYQVGFLSVYNLPKHHAVHQHGISRSTLTLNYKHYSFHRVSLKSQNVTYGFIPVCLDVWTHPPLGQFPWHELGSCTCQSA
jgi:hypothetical protein